MTRNPRAPGRPSLLLLAGCTAALLALAAPTAAQEQPAGSGTTGAVGDAELGPLVAEADAYAKEYHRRGEPYHGYYFKVLTRQGASPPGGAYDYVVNGNMIAGFAMVAWPADYGRTGVMTFAVNHRGTVYETDLGDETEALAPRIAAYDPGQGWEEVGEEEALP